MSKSAELDRLRVENRSLAARVTVLEAKLAQTIPADVVEEWQTILADLLWWFRGFQAVGSRRQRDTLPDQNRLRNMREDVFRVARGQTALSSHIASYRRDQEIPL